MNCPECGALSKVFDSRLNKNGSIRRRRLCSKCGRRWTTLEYDAEIVKAVNRIARLFQRVEPIERTPARNPKPPENSLTRHSGYIVPPELEDDWAVLKAHGYRDDEAAEALGGLVKIHTATGGRNVRI